MPLLTTVLSKDHFAIGTIFFAMSDKLLLKTPMRAAGEASGELWPNVNGDPHGTLQSGRPPADLRTLARHGVPVAAIDVLLESYRPRGVRGWKRRNQMKKIALAVAVTALMMTPGIASAAACRNAQGHFVKCPAAPAAAPSHALAPHAVTSPHAAIAPRAAPSHAAVPAASSGARRCRNAKGQFATCGTAGAKPV